MTFFKHLPHDEIYEIHDAAISLGLTASRRALFGGLPPGFVDSLPVSSTPAAQLLSDLQILNGIETLTDPDKTVPLHRWLTNALQSTSIRSESVPIARAQATLARRLGVPEAAPPAAPPRPLPAAAPPGALAPLPAQRRAPVAAFPASAVFVSIAGLAELDGPDLPVALSILHRVLRAPLADPALPGLRVLSSLTGAIVLVPDALNRNAHELLPAWLREIGDAGLAAHVGVSRGLVEMIEDADGTVNAIGRCLNIAARLALSRQNPGVLYDEPYADHVRGGLRKSHFLHPLKRVPIEVKGKRREVFTCFADPDAAPRASCEVPEEASAAMVNAVLLAYDLPDFSDGDLRALVSRFREVVREVQRLRELNNLPASAGISFSPGGDGGVLVLTQVPLERAFGLARDLATLLEAASTTQAAEAPVRARIGVHYGQVHAYLNAEGVQRPTGLSLFEADALAGDAEARRYDAVVISGALIESASHGARQIEADRFQRIAEIKTQQGTTLLRFVPREAVPTARAAVAGAPAAPTDAVKGEATATATPAWSTELSGGELAELHEALLSAFPTRSTLERMLRFRMDTRLDEIAGQGSLSDVVFEVIRDVVARGKVRDLFDAALAERPGNPDLLAIAERRRR
jgi:hypothetical protein